MTSVRLPTARATAVVAGLATVVALGSACTSRPAASVTSTSTAAAGPAGPAGTDGPSTTTPTGVAVAGAPAELSALLARVYGGGDLATGATTTAAAALKARTPATAAVSATAKTGTWKGTPIAVITAGEDVTLAVGPRWQVVGGWWPSLGVATPSLGSGPRWVLAMGSDARPGEDQERTRADTLQVVGLDGSGGGGILGIPRDLWVPLSTGGTGKINSALVFGGPMAQLQTVRTTTGLPIEGYLLVGFEGFVGLVDDLGAIPIVVPEAVTQGTTVIPKGEQVLTGRLALAYARERTSLPDGDFGRSRHQGQLLLAAALKARLAGPGAIPEALTVASEHVSSNLTAEQILTYSAGLLRVNPMQVGRGVAKGGFGTARGQSIVVLGTQARALFADFKDGNLS